VVVVVVAALAVAAFVFDREEHHASRDSAR